MLKDGLVYTESRMGYEQEFLEDLTAFDLKSANGTFRGGPVLFRKMIAVIRIPVTAMTSSLVIQDLRRL